ncbi:F0F1 ATP synthase subunit B, partial [Candidatus Peregrinibacteria bacterium CG10_big_fil_rev_8_21_14_0_10_54_7]
MELLTKLGINWQLLLAQIVNFAIVVGVLSFFLYKPLLNLIDTRRERIRKAMEDAQRIENQAKEMEELR